MSKCPTHKSDPVALHCPESKGKKGEDDFVLHYLSALSWKTYGGVDV
jgi:hypothetical protein